MIFISSSATDNQLIKKENEALKKSNVLLENERTMLINKEVDLGNNSCMTIKPLQILSNKFEKKLLMSSIAKDTARSTTQQFCLVQL